MSGAQPIPFSLLPFLQQGWGEDGLTYPERSCVGERARPVGHSQLLEVHGVRCPPWNQLIGPWASVLLGRAAGSLMLASGLLGGLLVGQACWWAFGQRLHTRREYDQACADERGFPSLEVVLCLRGADECLPRLLGLWLIRPSLSLAVAAGGG